MKLPICGTALLWRDGDREIITHRLKRLLDRSGDGANGREGGLCQHNVKRDVRYEGRAS